MSRVVSGDSQQKHILRVIVARTRRYLNNLLAGNLDWIFYFYLFIFFKFSIVFIYFFSSKAARACCDRTRSWFLTVWPSLQPRALIRFGEFLQPFLIEFPRYLCLQPGFFFSFTIGIFPFFIFRHSQSSFKRRHCHPEEAYWLQKWLLSNEKDSNTILPLNIWRLEVKR